LDRWWLTVALLAAMIGSLFVALQHGHTGGRTRIKAYYVGMDKVAVTVVDPKGRPLVGAPVEMKVNGRVVESSV